MKINGKDISLFGAKLIDYTIGGTPLTQYSADVMRYGIQNNYGTKTANKNITISLAFKPTWTPPLHYTPSIRERLNRVSEQITKFDAELLKSDRVEIELPNGYTYLCVPVTLGTAADDGSATHDSTYTFTGVQVLPMLTVKPLDGIVNCTSNTETDCIITVTAKAVIASANIFGIKIKNLNENDVVIIDGIKKTVMCNGVNKFADVDLTAFPTLLPGKNAVNAAPSECLDISVSYYPTFI